jgi:polysaccharide export outer membrane protein
MPKDELTITVITTNPQASAPFNLTDSNTIGSSGQSLYWPSSLQGYLSTTTANINFPVLAPSMWVG